jgi:hypothetical protein
MRYEPSNKYAPRTPLCPSCAQILRVARITSRFGDLPDLYTFECRACGVSHIEAAASSALRIGNDSSVTPEGCAAASVVRN